MDSKKIKYRWRQKRLWLSLILYWLVATGGARFIEKQYEAGWIILIMLIFVSICMITERGHWKLWQRIGFVPLAWIAEAILSPLAAFTIGVLVYSSGREHLVDRAIAFCASLPIIIFAMRQSKLFVISKHYLETNSNQPLNDT